MVAADQFPMFRLVTQLARQLSSPIATRIKEYARTHPRFSQTVCMNTGRAFRSAELRFRLWTLALRQPRHTPPISDTEALNIGADLLGEIVIFFLGAMIIVFEVNRQALKQEAKVLDERSQWVAVLMQLEELQQELALQQVDIDRLQNALRSLAPDAFTSGPSPSPQTPKPLPHWLPQKSISSLQHHNT